MVYIVTEDTDDITRNTYRTLRPFVLRVTDCAGREIMTLQRPFRCTCCCFCCPSARQEVREQSPITGSCRSNSSQRGCAFPKLHRRGFFTGSASQNERRQWGGRKPDCLIEGIHKGLFLVDSCFSELIGGSCTIMAI